MEDTQFGRGMGYSEYSRWPASMLRTYLLEVALDLYCEVKLKSRFIEVGYHRRCSGTYLRYLSQGPAVDTVSRCDVDQPKTFEVSTSYLIIRQEP